jgi:hypothetical protein
MFPPRYSSFCFPISDFDHELESDRVLKIIDNVLRIVNQKIYSFIFENNESDSKIF